jgi:hypothetical protein
MMRNEIGARVRVRFIVSVMVRLGPRDKFRVRVRVTLVC